MVININTFPKYKVILQQNCISDGSMKAFLSDYRGKKAAIICDKNVEILYLEKVKSNLQQAGIDGYCYSFYPGEENKNLVTVEAIYDFLCKNNFTRTDVIVALGGGIVGDTVGFAAATYLRGIKYIQIPTTLLAMVDSSIGGKTAVNLKAGKNLAGCFYQPDKVIIDTEVLTTLANDEILNGIGEIIKYGAIMDKKLFSILEKGDINNKEELIIRCLNIKKKIVEKDTLDTGLRQILNFGHTLGHAIERHSSYTISHGKAIGIGMVEITKWAEQRCLTKTGTAIKIANLLQKFNMPTEYALGLDELWEYAVNDKKIKGKSITLALIEEIGVMQLYQVEIDNFLNKGIDIEIKPSELKGKITAPPSKSMAHRAIFCAICSPNDCVIKNVDLSQDIQATINVAVSLGKKVNFNDGTLTLSGCIKKQSDVAIDCKESGTTFRFLLSILAVLGIETTITGCGKLGERPYDALAKQLSEKGAIFNKEAGLPLTIKGKITSGDFYMPGNISSQFISGLLLALPLLEASSKIILTSQLQSCSYVDMTIDCMKSFGVVIEKTAYGYYVEGNQKYTNSSYSVEGDYSNAAFFLCGAALNGKLEIMGLNKNSLQGDKQIINILQEMGADVKEISKGYKVKTNELKAIEVDAKNIPDLVPIISIVMAYAEGKSVIKNTKRLKLKECNRQQAIIDTLTKMDVSIKLDKDNLIINGSKKPNRGTFDSYNDHRMAMSLSIAALIGNEITIKGAEAVNKSYPNFYLDYKKAGGQYVINMGK